MPAKPHETVFASGEWEVDLACRELRARGVAVRIGARTFEIIETLIHSGGELVTKDEIASRVWPGAIVEDNTLQFHISVIRKALGSDRDILKTESGRGYRLLGDWRPRARSQEAPAIVGQLSPIAGLSVKTNLPAPVSKLIGRVSALRTLQKYLSSHRVVTAAGPGGIGKTALALEAARNAMPFFGGNAVLVEFAPLSDQRLVPSAVASALDLQLGGDEISAEAVARAIGHQRLLLVFDNCEHIIGAAASLAEAIVRHCPDVTILATSREPLCIAGEHVFRVPALDLPEDHHEAAVLIRNPAVQLFIERLSASGSDLASSGSDLLLVAMICRRLDGIPLAIEFAAARAATLGLQELASRLNDRFALLTSGQRTALPRHQTLRAMLDWSYDLLTESERLMMRRLSVFPAGFTLDGATAVVDNAVEGEVIKGISSLVAKSLLAEAASSDERRWRMLETIRLYSFQKLAESGELSATVRRQAKCLDRLIAIDGPDSLRELSLDDLRRYAIEIDNVRAVLDWAFSPDGDPEVGLVVVAAFTPVWLNLELMPELRERTEHALRILKNKGRLHSRLQVQLYIGFALTLIFTMAPVDRIKVVLGKALAIAGKLRDLTAQAVAQRALISTHHYSGECQAAAFEARKLSRIATRANDPALTVVADRLNGTAMHFLGSQEKAQALLEGLIQRYAPPRNLHYTLWFNHTGGIYTRAMLARTLWLRGSLDQAGQEAARCLKEAHEAGRKQALCRVVYHAQCFTGFLSGDLAATQQAVTSLVDLAAGCNARYWSMLASCARGKLLINLGEVEDGVRLLELALKACEKSGWTLSQPEYLGALGEGLAALGKSQAALATLDRGLARAEKTGEGWYVPELLRIKGELLLRRGGKQSSTPAETCFRQAMRLARRQGALFWELRAALAFANHRHEQNRSKDARRILAPVYERFAEGHGSAEMRAAKAMIESL